MNRLFMAAGAWIAFASHASAADAARGHVLFQKTCAACHGGAPDALGPSLAGIVGRSAASAADFRYSGPLRRSGLTWTADTLVAFIRAPQSLVKGNRMPFSGVEDPSDADDIVAYLGTLKAPDAASR
jgi:cytochrome c